MVPVAGAIFFAERILFVVATHRRRAVNQEGDDGCGGTTALDKNGAIKQ